jgi:hypothetical protein
MPVPSWADGSAGASPVSVTGLAQETAATSGLSSTRAGDVLNPTDVTSARARTKCCVRHQCAWKSAPKCAWKSAPNRFGRKVVRKFGSACCRHEPGREMYWFRETYHTCSGQSFLGERILSGRRRRFSSRRSTPVGMARICIRSHHASWRWSTSVTRCFVPPVCDSRPTAFFRKTISMFRSDDQTW